MPAHDCCQRQPTLVPGTLFSIVRVRRVADRSARQLGQRGDAATRKWPPHEHGRRNGSTEGSKGPCGLRETPIGMLLAQMPRSVLVPHVSQYAYAESLNPL